MEARESIEDVAVLEVGKLADDWIGQKNIDRAHGYRPTLSDGAMPQPCDCYVTPLPRL
jgi:hypothetical protein